VALISGSGHGFKFLPRIGFYIALMIEGKLPDEFAEKWKWRPGQEWEKPILREGTLVSKDFEETEGWAGSARHGPMAHTWGN
jgi:sarcosine oxidase / L-pipecolate oxidase